MAYHGSWNRNIPTGYKIVRYRLDDNGNIIQGANANPQDFITGWLVSDRGSILPGQAPEAALGRPVDILAVPGGVIYISDDKAGVIYRLVYGGRAITNEPEQQGSENTGLMRF